MNCKKCDSVKTVTLRKKDNYCDECFLTATNHKFRACLGKNKVLIPNENVLICLSGSSGSSVLLDLVQHGISLDNNKKLRIVPYFLHLCDDRNKDAVETVLNQCKIYNSELYIVHISDYMKADIQLPYPNTIPNIDQGQLNKFNEMLYGLPMSAACDFLSKVKRSLYMKCAKELECKTIFTAETTNILAINLLSNIVLGRGSQVENDVGFSDTRDEGIKILRPMRDISKEEIDYYIKIKQIKSLCDSHTQSHSVQSVIKSFIDDLQENFQSTISNVTKTADKIGKSEENQTTVVCSLCGSVINMNNIKLSALAASNLSRTVSLIGHDKHNEDEEQRVLEYNIVHKTMFPFIHKYLCYACSRIYSEIDESKLPQHVQTLFVE